MLELEDLTLGLNEQECNVSGKLKSIPFANESLQNIGLTYNGIPTYAIADAVIFNPLISSVEDFRVRTLATQESERELTANAADCGQSSIESFASYDPDTSSWRTSQRSLFGGLTEFSETWPRSGMTRNGIAYQQRPLAPLTDEIGFSLLPTLRANKVTGYSSKGYGETMEQRLKRLLIPTMGAHEYKGSSRARFRNSADFRGAKMSEGLRTCEDDPIYLNPSFAEVVMGFPIGWTDLRDSETPLSLKLQNGLEEES